LPPALLLAAAGSLRMSTCFIPIKLELPKVPSRQ
jgi:hypothetical protein